MSSNDPLVPGDRVSIAHVPDVSTGAPPATLSTVFDQVTPSREPDAVALWGTPRDVAPFMDTSISSHTMSYRSVHLTRTSDPVADAARFSAAVASSFPAARMRVASHNPLSRIGYYVSGTRAYTSGCATFLGFPDITVPHASASRLPAIVAAILADPDLLHNRSSYTPLNPFDVYIMVTDPGSLGSFAVVDVMDTADLLCPSAPPLDTASSLFSESWETFDLVADHVATHYAADVVFLPAAPLSTGPQNVTVIRGNLQVYPHTGTSLIVPVTVEGGHVHFDLHH